MSIYTIIMSIGFAITITAAVGNIAMNFVKFGIAASSNSDFEATKLSKWYAKIARKIFKEARIDEDDLMENMLHNMTAILIGVSLSMLWPFGVLGLLAYGYYKRYGNS